MSSVESDTNGLTCKVFIFCAAILLHVRDVILVPAFTIVLPSSDFTFSVGVCPIKVSGFSADTVVKIFLYGVSMKPKGLVFAYVASETSNPMLGPSGVSMGQILP